MTEVRNPVITPMRRAFDSVFTRESLRPPSNPQRFYLRENAVEELRLKILTESSRIIFGMKTTELRFSDDEQAIMQEAMFARLPPGCPDMLPLSEPRGTMMRKELLTKIRPKLLYMLRVWRVQRGGDHVRKVFAGVLDGQIAELVTRNCSGNFYQPVISDESRVISALRSWVEEDFAGYVMEVLDTLALDEQANGNPRTSEVSPADIENWFQTALTRLGALRVNELFNIVTAWPSTMSGIVDIKNYVTNPAARGYLVSNFINALQTRLLHPGTSTIEILRTYIKIIRSFRRLDPKGVLLDRVARVIRRYLRDRDDTVGVIVGGLLSDSYLPVNPKEAEAHAYYGLGDNPYQKKRASPDPNVLTELAFELGQQSSANNDEDDELDWDNMDWMPDPIDAAPDYRKSKNTDVLGSLISLFETKDVFVKELQTTLADRLLRNKTSFEQEISVLAHLKLRFGDSALQACEVMLRDILDSTKLDDAIRTQLRFAAAGYDMDDGPRLALPNAAPVHTKILSRLFWPPLADTTFIIPGHIKSAQEHYDQQYAHMKRDRKLTWLDSLGEALVELEFADHRRFKERVATWQAVVIYAFDDYYASGRVRKGEEAPKSKTVDELANSLDMPPQLVHAACAFWVSKHVLTHTSADPATYTVLEIHPSAAASYPHLSSASASRTPATRPQPAASLPPPPLPAPTVTAASLASSAAQSAQHALYVQFVMSMLTNQGAMPLPRIAMMLGIVVPGGCALSSEELKEFLAGMVREGKLEVGVGGVYRVRS